MSNVFGNIQELPEPARVRFVCADAIVSVGRALSEIDVSDPDVLARFEALVQRLDGLDTLVSEDISLDTPVATMLISLLLSDFMKPGVAESAWDSVMVIDNQWSPEHQIKGTFDVKVLNASILSLFCLTSLYRDGRQDMDLAAAGSRALLRLATTLERADRLETALACAHSARNVAFGDATVGEPASLAAVTLALRAGDLENIAVLASLYADNLIILAQKDQTRRVEAYDASERALRALRRQDDYKPELLELFKQRTFSEAYLRPLQPTLWSLFPEAERPAVKDLPVSAEKLARMLDTSISGAADDFVSLMIDLRGYAIAAEDLRLRLEPAGRDTLAHTSSHAWTVDHPALRRAVPHSGSFLRERDLDAMLLVLQHEISHVLSLTSPLGLSLLVLRFSEFELEAELWALVAKDEKANYAEEFFTGKAPAQLKDGNPAGLAWAEQQIDLERKAQILEDCWAPWFEGIAVFGETAGDPRDEPDASSPTIDVVFNLWERKLRSAGDTRRHSGSRSRTRGHAQNSCTVKRSNVLLDRDYEAISTLNTVTTCQVISPCEALSQPGGERRPARYRAQKHSAFCCTSRETAASTPSRALCFRSRPSRAKPGLGSSGGFGLWRTWPAPIWKEHCIPMRSWRTDGRMDGSSFTRPMIRTNENFRRR